MRRTPEEEWRTAVHESGHAVVSRVLGFLCGKVSIKPDYREGTAGYGIIEDPYLALDTWEQRGKYHRSLEAAFRARILTYMAGREAEEEVLGRCQGGDSDDQFQIALMLEQIYREERREERQERLRKFGAPSPSEN
jgi:ATP-dependent Zn protease